MRKKQNATTRSKNGSSKKIDSNSKISVESNHDLFVQKFFKKYEGNAVMQHFIIISQSLNKKLDNESMPHFNVNEIIDAYELLAYPNKNFIVEQENTKDIEIYSKGLLFSIYCLYGVFGINLELLESNNIELKGLNNFLVKESPVEYKAYCELSNKFKFKTVVQISDESFNANEMDDGFLYYFKVICIGLGYKIKDEKNEAHQIDNILDSFSSLMGTKCKYSLDSDGSICYKLEDNKVFEESKESGLVIFLGIFACFKLNLEYLEFQNPELKGLNKFLLLEYAETYNAYRALTNQYGFEGTVKLGFNGSISPEKVYSFWMNMKVDKWKNVLNKQYEVIPDEKQTHS